MRTEKRTWVLLAYVLILAVALTYSSFANAGQEGPHYRVFTENGGMNVTERGISEGHKSYHLFGIEGSLENMRAKGKVGIEGFFRGEPADEDPEIPQFGAGAFAEYSYKMKDWVHPYLGVRFDHIARDVAPKHQGDPQFEDVVDFFSATGGFHMQYKWLYADIGTIIPFYTNNKSGNFGPDVGVGVKWKNWDVGYRFKEVRFTDNHLQGGESLSFYFSGLEIGYSF